MDSNEYFETSTFEADDENHKFGPKYVYMDYIVYMLYNTNSPHSAAYILERNNWSRNMRQGQNTYR